MSSMQSVLDPRQHRAPVPVRMYIAGLACWAASWHECPFGLVFYSLLAISFKSFVFVFKLDRTQEHRRGCDILPTYSNFSFP
jgi:hypothetical protein